MIAYTMGLLLAILGAWSSALSRWTSKRPLLPDVPPARPPFGVWSALGVCALYLVITGLVTWASGLKPEGDIKKLPVDTLLIITTASNAAMLAAVPLFLFVTSRARPADLGIPGRDPVGDVGRGAWMILLVLPVVILIGAAVTAVWPHTEDNRHPLETLVTESLTAKSLLLALLSGVVFAPLAEELMFRGVFLPALMRPFLSPRADATSVESPYSSPEGADPIFAEELAAQPVDPLAEPYTPPRFGPAGGLPDPGIQDAAFWVPNVLTSLFFALMHGPQWPAPIPLFVFSMALGWARQRTGGLVAPIVMHMLFNLNSTVLLAFSMKAGVE